MFWRTGHIRLCCSSLPPVHTASCVLQVNVCIIVEPEEFLFFIIIIAIIIANIIIIAIIIMKGERSPAS